MDDTELLLRFCNARHKYQEQQRSTAEERSEVHETYKSVHALLVESMRRNGHRCVRCVHADGTTFYVRLVEGRRRAMTLKSNDDVMELLQNVGPNVTHVSLEDLPDAIARLVEARARTRGADVPSRAAVVPRVGVREHIVEQTSTCRELQTLTAQMTQSDAERRRLRHELTPARNELREAERKLCATVSGETPREVSEVVRVNAPPSAAAPQSSRPPPPRTLSVATVVRPKRRNVFGIRNVCRCVREAAGNVQERDERFDERLRAETLRVLEREQALAAQEWTRKVVVKRHRA